MLHKEWLSKIDSNKSVPYLLVRVLACSGKEQRNDAVARGPVEVLFVDGGPMLLYYDNRHKRGLGGR